MQVGAACFGRTKPIFLWVGGMLAQHVKAQSLKCNLPERTQFLCGCTRGVAAEIGGALRLDQPASKGARSTGTRWITSIGAANA
jgi:hypothetical protein